MNYQPRSYLEREIDGREDEPGASIESAAGPVANIARHYVPDKEAKAPYRPDRLLGFLLNLSYEDVTIVTCDPWKRNCGGVPRNSLVLVKLSAGKVSKEERAFCDRIIMVRVTESVPTPVASEIQQTIFQIHKAQANIDPITNKEFQWSGLKGTIVGTFYDKQGDTDSDFKIGFGLDVDTFFAPHCYEVYVPDGGHLGSLINAFNDNPKPLQIGFLKYTETPSAAARDTVPVLVDPEDFTGKSYGHRTALFGKTRYGKSNTMKVVADTILSSDRPVGQIVFDPSGEYTYWNEQDHGCLAARHAAKCTRFSLKPRPAEIEKTVGLEAPSTLKIDFYRNPDVGHGLIRELWVSEIGEKIPDYMTPVMNWEPEPVEGAPRFEAYPSGFYHYWRTMGIWWAILAEAGFVAPAGTCTVKFPKNTANEVLQRLSDIPALAKEKTRTGSQRLVGQQAPTRCGPADPSRRDNRIHISFSHPDYRSLYVR
jgi:hypothetical protein